jgi:ketosteroid isomerase-like protein
MSHDPEIFSFLTSHIQSIMENDVNTYHDSTAEDLTLYEWFVTPHRIDGIPFHDFMMESAAGRGSVFGAEVDEENTSFPSKTRFDLANLHIQRYGDTAIASYTMMLSTSLPTGVKVVAHNESRVIVRIDNNWQVVHCHKSPAWQAPHQAPSNSP